MKNKKNVILIVFLVVLFLIPIFWMVTKAILNIPKVDDASIAEANKRESQRVFLEKEKYAKEHENCSNEISQTNLTEPERDPMIEEEGRKALEKTDKTIAIIEKYHESEYKEIVKDLEKDLEKEREENKEKIVDLTAKPLSENERKLFDLVLSIIENENLSSEELSLLKDFLINDRTEVNKNSELKNRADKVLD